MKTISKCGLLEIKRKNRSIHIYLRKKMAVIDGHKYYRVVGMTYAEMKQFNLEC